MKLFSYAENHPDGCLALTEQGEVLCYRELLTVSDEIAKAAGGKLIFVLCRNTPGLLLGYLGSLRAAVPLLLDAALPEELLKNLLDTYRPGFVFLPQERCGAVSALLPAAQPVLTARDGCLLATGWPGPELNPALRLLLTTSGSTGSQKLVRLSAENLDANTISIAEYLDLDENERPITNLPMQYSYGMSVINSHLLVGAPIQLTEAGIAERRFWELMAQRKITSLVGVPYTYRMFDRLGLRTMDLPALRTLTQAGGKLPEELHRVFADWAAQTGRRFFVMYGQTEAAPRMGYLPAERAVEKCGCMGIPVPGGSFALIDDAGEPITEPDTVGELVYTGANVGLGYALCAQDLLLGDEWQGVLRTGDMAKRDADGFYSIVGRKKRFVKLYGSRVNLDQVERLLGAKFPELRFACAGRDDRLSVYAEGAEEAQLDAVRHYLCEEVCLPPQAVFVAAIAQIPRNDSGKTLYAKLPEI